MREIIQDFLNAGVTDLVVRSAVESLIWEAYQRGRLDLWEAYQSGKLQSPQDHSDDAARVAPEDAAARERAAWRAKVAEKEADLQRVLQRYNRALEVITKYGLVQGEDHKQWVIDQMVRTLTGCDPARPDEVTDTYEWVTRSGWQTGIAPAQGE